MSARDLIAEAERLARPSLLLTEAAAGADIVAWWGGSRSFRDSSRPDDVHKLSVDCRWLSAHGYHLDGVLRVYTVARRWNWVIPVHVLHDGGSTLQRIPDAIPLYGREVPSLPPFEALCLYGGPAIDGWLAAAGLDRVDYDEAMARPDAAEYQAYFQDRCPLFTGGAAAVLGGWHLRWDDDYYLPREMRLVLWTLKDAEPWIEIFQRGVNLIPRERTT